jgi:dTDP-4-dehydrorhamnose reductase
MSIEMWGGVECTVCRVGDVFRDQTVLTGHHVRSSDLDRIAALGIKALRYPVLWERVAPDGLASADWSWTDQRLFRLRELGIQPVVTLCHHGSGPRSTGLLEPSFAGGLAAFARAVAERYPWITDYTPVNEPLTTARFSALYGHWYPHACDPASFGRALANELEGTVLAMQRIRQVQPMARLIQTEDFAAVHATPLLRDQAAHENERRWLTFDLLCGVENAVARQYLPPADLEWLAEHRCPPALIGLNYYVTSERLLDDRLERYPRWTHGGNGQKPYADVEAVRAVAEGLVGHLGALHLAWARYRLPVGFTEVHLGSVPEEQVRWLDEAWWALEEAQREGIDARVLTAWSLFGAVDWSSLLTRDEGVYEPGAFALRGLEPHETDLAAVIRERARGEVRRSPLLDSPGWWRRSSRLIYPPVHVDHELRPSAPKLRANVPLTGHAPESPCGTP